MGNTFRPLRETQSAVAGVLQDGRTASVRGPAARRRQDGGALPGSSASPARPATSSTGVTGISGSRVSPIAAVGPTGRPTSCRSRSRAGSWQLRKDHPTWGAPKIREKLRRLDLGIQTPAISTVHAVLDRHGLVARRRATSQGRGDAPLLAPPAQRALVRRLQGRVHARRPSLLLPAHHHRLRQPLPARLRGPRQSPGITRLCRVRTCFKEFGLPGAIRTDNGVPFSCPRALFGLSRALGLVAAPRHRHRTHQARPSPAERAPRTHAPDPEEGSHPAGRGQPAAAAGPLR